MADITDEIKSGNVESFKELFDDYFPMLCCIAQRVVGNVDVSEDIAQNSLMKYWQLRNNFDNIFKVKSFLYTATHNEAITRLHRDSRLASIADHDQPTETADLDHDIIRHETFLLVRRSVDALPAQMRRIIELSMQGYSNREIAEELGIAEGTVHSLKKRSYSKLRKSLKQDFYMLMLL